MRIDGVRHPRIEAPTAKAFLKQPIFFLEVLDHIELPTIDPATEQLRRTCSGWMEGNIRASMAGYGPWDPRIVESQDRAHVLRVFWTQR